MLHPPLPNRCKSARRRRTCGWACSLVQLQWNDFTRSRQCLYSSVVERCKLKVMGSIPSGGFVRRANSTDAHHVHDPPLAIKDLPFRKLELRALAQTQMGEDRSSE